VRFISSQEEFSRFLQIVSRALASKSTVPVLNGILLKTKENSLNCVATDLEIALEVTIHKVEIIEPGAAIVPGKTFVDIIKHLPATEIEVFYDETTKNMHITCQDSSYQLPTLPLEEFPVLPVMEEGLKIQIKAEQLREAIRQTIFATTADDSKPYLTGIFFELTDNQTTLVATDVSRLAIKKIQTNKENNKGSALIPVRAMREIMNIFTNTEIEPLQITLTEKLIFISSAGINFSSRLIAAQFPAYTQVIPKEFNGIIQVKRTELIEALERTVVVSSLIRFKITSEKIIINAKEPDKGRSHEEIKNYYDGKEMEIGFNAKFLLEFLRVIESESVEIKVVHEQRPVVFQGDHDSSYLYVVMPLKLAI